MRRAAIIIFLVLFIDQALKFWIKTHMYMNEEFQIFNWFRIHFTENNGMAFGYEFGGAPGKTFLSVFRIVASFGIGWYLFTLIKKNSHPGLITCFSLIFAGAIGNILDSAFYGMIFNDDVSGISKAFAGDGYSGFLHGRVVDMLYFPLVNSQFPSWFPIWHDEPFQFFRPIFNVADSSITVGVFLFIFFQKKFTAVKENEDIEGSETLTSVENS